MRRHCNKYPEKGLGLNQHKPEFRFCHECGGRMKKIKPKECEPERLVCSSCNFVYYQDPKLVACSIVEREGAIVLLKRGLNPQKGKWVMPGGYVDRGEKVEDAVVRETLEECGLKIKPVRMLGVYSYTGYVPVVIVYISEYVMGDLISGDETMEAGLFKKGNIPWSDLAFQSTIDALKDYCDIK